MSIIAKTPVRQKLYYYCDETSHTPGDDYMAVGGIAVNMASADEIEKKITEIRDRLSLCGEIKWSNAKDRRDSGQKAYAELLRELVENNNVHFHMRFQRTSDWNHERAGERKKIDTVSRAFYQLVLHRPITFYGHQADIHVRPDKGDCTARLHQFMGQLNTEAGKPKHCGMSCVRSIHTVESRQNHFLQLLDVTIGGLAAVRNNRHKRADVTKHKHDLAMHIHGLWGNFDLSTSHPKDTKKFNIWNARPLK
jgi:truncated hemoglobin YjbI